MTTNVPQPTLGPTGFIAPLEADILAGRQADFNAAFGTTLNFVTTSGSQTNATPQGQLAASDAAIIGNTNNQFLALANGVDPAYASGRMQDAIGRIYFMERLPDQSTVVECTCIGSGATVPTNSSPGCAKSSRRSFSPIRRASCIRISTRPTC